MTEAPQQMIDRAFGQGAGDPQPGFLQQILGRTVVADHALQRPQQHLALGLEDIIETGLGHRKARPEIKPMIMLIICSFFKLQMIAASFKLQASRKSRWR